MAGEAPASRWLGKLELPPKRFPSSSLGTALGEAPASRWLGKLQLLDGWGSWSFRSSITKLELGNE